MEVVVVEVEMVVMEEEKVEVVVVIHGESGEIHGWTVDNPSENRPCLPRTAQNHPHVLPCLALPCRTGYQYGG